VTRHPLDACAIVERDFVSAWWLLADAPGHELHDQPRLRWYHTGVDDPHANAVLVTALDESEADAVIDETIAELTDRGSPFIWWVMPSARPADLDDRLTSRGFVADDAWPGMAVATDAIVPPLAFEGLEIRRVSNEADYAAYLGVFTPILSPSEAFSAFFDAGARRIGFADAVPEEHFLGLVDDEPVATASLITAGGAAGIYNVTTIERMRGRGIGAAMTVAAVHHGHERGLRLATLQASTMGRPVYERLGFRHVCDLIPYRLGG
jgi:GNAT superfamily N-acetyltransferase